MLCTNCRKIITDNSNNCPFCGASFRSQSTARKTPAVTQSKPTQYYRSPSEQERIAAERYNRQINAIYEPTNSSAGKGAGEASLVFGIIGVICWFFGYSSIISVIAGAIGWHEASVSKRAGYEGSERRIGAVLSCFSLIVGLIIFLFACGIFIALFNSK